MSNRVCDICGRAEGSLREPGDVPLGPVEPCRICHRMTCPDCEHESDCCFVEQENHADDPAWAPPGWRRLNEFTWEPLE